MKDRQSGGALRLAGLAALPALKILLAVAVSPARADGQDYVSYPPPDPETGVLEIRATTPERAPVADAQVTIGWRTPGVRLPALGAVGDTDGTGLYRVELPEGLWSIEARANGHLPATVPELTLSADEVKPVEVALVPVEVTEVTVRVTGPVPGGEVDEIAPIEGARVVLADRQGVPTYVAVSSTDARGLARFERVTEGTYSLSVKHSIYPAMSLRDLRITLESEGLEARMEAPPDGWAPVSGRVVREGMGVADTCVRLSALGPQGRHAFTTHSDGDGGFTFPWLPVGDYAVAWGERHAAGSTPQQRLPDVLSVQPAGIDGLELPLHWTVHVHGRVENLEPTSKIGYYVAAASVPEEEGIPHSMAFGELGDGRFHGLHLPAGTWDVIVHAQSRVATRRVVVPESALEGGAEMEVALALPAGRTVRGEVLRRGEPMKGVRVSLHPVRRDAAGATGSLGMLDPTGPDGQFVIHYVPPGEYDLSVSHWAHRQIHEERVTIAETDAELTVEARPGVLAGRVIDAVTGEPVRGPRFEIRYRGPGGDAALGIREIRAEAAGDGTFRIDPLRAGPWSYRFSAPGFSESSGRFDLPAEGTGPPDGELTIEMRPTAGLLLHVTMDDGQVPREVAMELLEPDTPEKPERPWGPWEVVESETSWHPHLGTDPVVHWRDAPAGRWLLEIWTEAFGLVRREVEISERTAGSPVEIVLPSAGYVVVSLPGVEWTEMPDPSEIRFTLIDPGGEVLEIDCESCRLFGNRLVAEDVPPGRYVATVAFPDGRSWSAEVEVMPGEQSEVELLPEGSS